MACTFAMFGFLVALLLCGYLVWLGGREAIRRARENPAKARALMEYLVTKPTEAEPEGEQEADELPEPEKRNVKGRLM